MRPGLRHVFNNAFTIYSVLAIVLMAATLLVILGPMLARGATAVAFQGSVEFRQMQLNEFGRGDRAAVTAEVAQVEAARQNVYDLLEGFQRGIDVSGLEDRARHILREFRQQLRNRVSAAQMTDEQYDQLTQRGQHVRDLLLDAYETTDKATAEAALDKALALCQGDVFAGTVAEAFAAQGDDYRKVIQQIDLSHRQEYAEQLKDVQENLTWLFGPRPGQATADLAVYRYGATRRDMAEKRLHELLYAEKWVPTGPGQQLKKTYVPRADIFADTSLAGLFGLVQQNFEQMMHFRWTIYWHYFSDAGIQGHYFGGVGPEILGTILLSLLAMAFAVPLGVITGAYLAESDAEGIFIRIIRTCINALAGVPSIVFGLFGLAFFVLWLLPNFGFQRGSSMMAGGLTLAVLVLPVIIRASEEAIRGVPQSYKEASLALGAGPLSTFVLVQLPAAMPGILTGVILSLSRAAGETAPILFTAAVAIGPIPTSLADPTRALPYSAYVDANSDALAATVPHNQYGIIMTLVLLVLLLNFAAIFLRARLSKRLRA